MNYDFDLLVIGAGSGGVRCARIAAQHGARVAIIEKQHWGGTCVNIGCVPKKLMMLASTFNDLVEDSQGYGWDTRKGQHHWSTLIRAKDREIQRLNGIYISLLEKAGVQRFVGHAVFQDTHTILMKRGELSSDSFHEQTITAERIVIATGSRPSILDIEGKEYGITSDQVFHLAERPQRICILGSGYIGIEFAGIFAGLGSKVDLIYRQPVPLRGFDEDLRHVLFNAITQRGIRQHSETKPVKIVKQEKFYQLYLENGEIIDTDCVFFATGRHPNIDGLALETIGVKTGNKKQISVDENFQTSIGQVYAIGDVIDRVNLTPVAIAQGQILAEHLYGDQTKIRKADFDRISKAVFFSPPLASVGLTEEQAIQVSDIEIYISQFTPMRYAFTQRKPKTFIKLVVDKKSQKILGLHMMGDDSPEILQGFAVAISAGLTKAELDQTLGIHPTSAEELVTLRELTRIVSKKNTSTSEA